jgi:hypothetical protein
MKEEETYLDIILKGYKYQAMLGNKKLYYSHALDKYKMVDAKGNVEDFNMGGFEL